MQKPPWLRHTPNSTTATAMPPVKCAGPVEAYRTDLYDVGNDANNYQTWTDIYNFTYTNGNTQFSYYYQDLYRGINFTNQVLEYAPKIPAENITEAKRGEIIAEAHFLRGYFHMMLLLNWEKIILRDIYISDAADLNKPLSDGWLAGNW